MTQRREIVELGGGSGRLAADLLIALAARDALPSRYAILEVSPDLAQRQRATLARDAPAHLDRVAWLAALPETIDGTLIANEVLDAVPVGARRAPRRPMDRARRDLGRRARRLRMGRVAGRRAPRGHCRRALSAGAATTRARSIRPPRRLSRTSADGSSPGRRCYIDYGFPAAEYYHPQRSEGTLMCHYRHRAHGDPFAWPGLTDITAHVDFTAMAEAGERAGLHVAGFAAQAPFLLGCGILDALAATGAPESPAYIRAAAAVQKLLAPSEMGELFKVLALARSEAIAWPGFGVADRRHRL